MKLRPGTCVGQNVRLTRLLGEGGMGSVWVGFHLTLHTGVAVKFMSAKIADKPAAITRFSREAMAAAQIKSPHVVQIFDHGVTDQNLPFIVMELLEGEDLHDRLEREGRFGLRQVVEIVTQTAKALSRAHALGIVHRDIKPSNIFFVTSSDETFVKVLDFGIARRLDHSLDMTGTGAMVGTPNYMSPEQVLSARTVDFQADLWSLAVVAYHMLTGELPFTGETMGAVFLAIQTGEFAAPSSLCPNLPAGVDAWFARALARNPNDRFGSAKEMAAAFRAVAAGGSVPKASEPPPDSGSLPLERLSGAPAELPSSREPHTLMETSVTSTIRQPRMLAAVVGVLVAVAVVVVAGLVFITNVSAVREQPVAASMNGASGAASTNLTAHASPKPAASEDLPMDITALPLEGSADAALSASAPVDIAALPVENREGHAPLSASGKSPSKRAPKTAGKRVEDYGF